MEQWTVSKLGKEYVKAIYCHPAYLASMQSTSCEMQCWLDESHMESRLLGEISITSDVIYDTLCWIIEKAREFQKNTYFCFIDYTKAFDCVDHNNL